MVRVITQETYDEVVSENIEEFDMSPEEAIKEATAQFEAQGVDLSNIIKDLVQGSGEQHQVCTTVNKLKDVCSQTQCNDEMILKEIDVLRIECNKDIARRVRAGKEGAYDILIGLLDKRTTSYIEKENEKDETMIVSILNALISLMDMQPDLLDQRGVDFIKSSLDKIENDCILISTLNWTSICLIKHEMNRQRVFAKNIVDSLKTLINKKKSNVKILNASMQVIRKFSLDDDIRVEFGKAHEHAKEMGAKVLEPLTKLLEENTDPKLVSEIMNTMAALLVRHELCKLVSDAGVGESLFGALAAGVDNVGLVMAAGKLITALAGNDEVKRQLMKAGIAPVLVTLLNRHSSNALAASLLLKCISALCLREPGHGRQFFDCGAPEPIIGALKVHPEHAGVQKNGCWAIRNMVARCREQNPRFHELGVEEVLQAAYKRFENEFGFDVKSALRDLECDVKLDEQWTGKGVQMSND